MHHALVTTNSLAAGARQPAAGSGMEQLRVHVLMFPA